MLVVMTIAACVLYWQRAWAIGQIRALGVRWEIPSEGREGERKEKKNVCENVPS